MSTPLLLDEMHAPVVATALRQRAHDVIAVAEQVELRALTDEELFDWATERGRRIVTENVKDFAPLIRSAHGSLRPDAGLLFTSRRTFPRTRRNPGPLIEALDAWLRGAEDTVPPVVDWPQPAQARSSQAPTTTQAEGEE